jgi:hypothetical protein
MVHNSANRNKTNNHPFTLNQRAHENPPHPGPGLRQKQRCGGLQPEYILLFHLQESSLLHMIKDVSRHASCALSLIYTFVF